MSFPRYPEYKDSGVEWLGEVPGHWEINQLKHAYSVVGGSTPSSGIPELWDGDIVWVTPSDLSKLKSFEIGSSLRTITDAGLASCGTNLLPVGSIVLSTRAPIGSLGIAGVELCTNQGCKGLVPKSDQCSLFGAYLLAVMGGELNIQGRGTTFLELSGEALGAVKIPLPPESEQACIAAFLDRETAKIDALVAEQQNLIALLKEKRQALISHAVTKGLDPDVPMKDSGVAWLGEVPAHWGVSALGYLATIETGATPDRAEPRYWNGSIPWLKTGEINWAPIREAEEFITEEGVANTAVRVAKPGMLLMAMYGQGATRGRVARLEIEATYNQACAAILFGDRLLPEFGRYFFMAAYEHVRDGGNETSQMNLSAGLIAKIRLPVPRIDEQVAVVLFLDSEIANLDGLTAEAERAIAFLQERRTALISAAVTGKIDVRRLAVACAEPTPEPA